MRVRLAALVLFACLPGWGQQKITLGEAVAIALKNNPRLELDRVNSLISEEVTTEVRSALFPAIVANTTAAGATTDSRLAAGALNNPIIFNRYAAGASISQLITDFGRTSSLVASSRLRTRSQQETAVASRALVVLAVHRAYLSGLRALGVLGVAEQTVKARELVLEQVSALAKSNLRSILDVSFAEVNLSEARLAVAAARNEHQVALAELSFAMGYSRSQSLELEDLPGPAEALPETEEFIAEATRNRAELSALRFEREAALRIATAERKLALPTLSALANMGVAPVHDDRLKNRYAAAGINLSLPVFNGYLNNARRTEAELKVQAIDQRLRDLSNQIAREVTTSVLNAQTAFERIGLTEQLLKQAGLAAELARERYDLGLSSIVELSQAQLNQTAAAIRGTAAKYDYLLTRSIVEFQTGRLR